MRDARPESAADRFAISIAVSVPVYIYERFSIENETESEGADFVWFNVDDFFDDALHTKALSS